MPFREKVKKAFGKSHDDASESSSDLSHVQSKASTKKSKKPKVEYPDNVYKPGEIPESKYKGPYDKQHQQKLHAFSFANAFQGRRKSVQSLYSPMGSRIPSRVGSFISRRSFGNRSRQQSRVEDTLMEDTEADDTVENVGMSRQQTREEVPAIPIGDSQSRTKSRKDDMKKTAETDNVITNDRVNKFEQPAPNYRNGMDEPSPLTNGDTRHIRSGSFGQPFSADDLVHAMTNSTLKPSVVQA
ncbi:MAG: hypothetical protein L6R37_001386 [Teloschistes peruensis]|nr:MAG: hypothetical protein L6R37_001386 [Teloschistes peruensis]